MPTDIRERVARAMAREFHGDEKDWREFKQEAKAVLAEIGLTQASPQAELLDAARDALALLRSLPDDCVMPDHPIFGKLRRAIAKASPQPQASAPYDGAHSVSGWVWFRESTQEWVLELEGSINGCSFVVRHAQPKTTAPEDVPGLPSLYDRPQASAEDVAVIDSLVFGSGLRFHNDAWKRIRASLGVK